MVGFSGRLYYNYSYMTAHNQWLSTTRSIPYWTTSVFSSTVTNDEWRILAHTLNCLEGHLSDEWLTIHSLISITPISLLLYSTLLLLEVTNQLFLQLLGGPHRRHRLEGYHYCVSRIRYLGNASVFSNLLPGKRPIRCYCFSGNVISGSLLSNGRLAVAPLFRLSSVTSQYQTTRLNRVISHKNTFWIISGVQLQI
jgi:hypothetical protein